MDEVLAEDGRFPLVHKLLNFMNIYHLCLSIARAFTTPYEKLYTGVRGDTFIPDPDRGRGEQFLDMDRWFIQIPAEIAGYRDMHADKSGSPLAFAKEQY